MSSLRYNGPMTPGDVGRARDRVVVGLSGGVDSAVAAALLMDQGYDVHALALSTWRAVPEAGSSISAAAEVAEALGIPFHQADLEDTFFSQVVRPFLDDYAQGRTPNPCVFCNPTLKFAALIEAADRLNARWIATGHYARVARSDEGVSRLLRGRAEAKDQSYALYRLTQAHLGRLLLPLGNLTSKAEVRAQARERHIPSADTGDSQDLCFATGTTHQAMIARLRPDAVKPGPIYDAEGRSLGKHRGLPFYTVGQRGGLGITARHRLYVLRIDPEANALIVGPRSGLATASCSLTRVTFTSGQSPSGRLEVEARIRYRAPLTPVTVEMTSADAANVAFHTNQFGVAPGQSLVLYKGDETLGGGVITT